MNHRQPWLDAYRRVSGPPADRKGRNLAALRARLAAEVNVSSEELAEEADVPEPVASPSVLGKSVAISVAIAAGVLLMLRVGHSGWQALRDGASTRLHEAPSVVTPTQPPTHATRPAPDSGGPALAPAVVEPPGDDVPASTTVAPDPAPRRHRAAAPTTADPPARDDDPVDVLAREVALMRDARAALGRGDAAAVWRLTERHAREHPDGALEPEREAWRVVAACMLRRPDAAQRVARFARQFPDSVHRARVTTACEGMK